MTEEVSRLKTAGRIYVYESFPVLYLLSRMRPASHFLYRACPDDRDACLARYLKMYSKDNLVFHVKRYRYNLDVIDLADSLLPSPDPLAQYFAKTHKTILSTAFYDVSVPVEAEIVGASEGVHPNDGLK
jgi:hypothetical protein